MSEVSFYVLSSLCLLASWYIAPSFGVTPASPKPPARAHSNVSYTLLCSKDVVYAWIGDPLAISCSVTPPLTKDLSLSVSVFEGDPENASPLPAAIDAWYVWPRTLYTFHAEDQRLESYVYGSGDNGFIRIPTVMSLRGPFPILIRTTTRTHDATFVWTILNGTRSITSKSIAVNLAAKPKTFDIRAEDALNITGFPAKIIATSYGGYPPSSVSVKWYLDDRHAPGLLSDIETDTHVKYTTGQRGTFDAKYTLNFPQFINDHQLLTVLFEHTWTPPKGFEKLFRAKQTVLHTSVAFINRPLINAYQDQSGMLICVATNVSRSLGHITWTANGKPFDEMITFARSMDGDEPNKPNTGHVTLISMAEPRMDYFRNIIYACEIYGYSLRFPRFYAEVATQNSISAQVFPLIIIMSIIAACVLGGGVLILCAYLCSSRPSRNASY